MASRGRADATTRARGLAQALDRRARLQISRGQFPDRKFWELLNAAARAMGVREARRARWSQSNPISRDQLLERAYRLHQAVGRNLHRKRPPSKRQIAIEKAYARAVRMLEWAKRRNPAMARRRRRRNPSVAEMAAPPMPKRKGPKRHGPKGFRSPRPYTAAKARRAWTPGAEDVARIEASHKRLYAGRTSGKRKKAFGPESEAEFRTRKADEAYRRQLAYGRRKRKKAAEARARRARAARKGASTRRRKSSMRGVPRKIARYPGLAKAWLRKHGRKRRKTGRRKSSLARWSQLSRGKRFGRKIRAAVRGYGRSLKLRSRASITAKEHRQGLKAAASAFRRQNPKRRRRRRNPSALIVNPRRRRRNPMRRRRRRNPAFGGVVKDMVKTAVPALATGALLGFLDAKPLDGKPAIVRVLAKVGVGVAGGIGLSKIGKAQMGAAVAAAAFGTIGYDGGVKLGGGVQGGGKMSAMGDVAALAAEDEQAMGVLTESLSGFGVLQGADDVEAAAAEFGGTDPLEVEDSF
jgi:hypothetical protein